MTALLCIIFALVFAGVVLAALPIVRAWNGRRWAERMRHHDA